MIASVCSVRVSDFTIAMEMPKPTAAPSAIELARIDLAGRGPHDHDNADEAERDRGDLPDVMRSPRNIAARIAVQIGMVNSIATTWPIAISVNA